jgi:hypothetical protein
MGKGIISTHLIPYALFSHFLFHPYNEIICLQGFFFWGGRGGGGGGGEREREMAKIYYGISKHKVSLVVLQIYNEII